MESGGRGQTNMVIRAMMRAFPNMMRSIRRKWEAGGAK